MRKKTFAMIIGIELLLMPLVLFAEDNLPLEPRSGPACRKASGPGLPGLRHGPEQLTAEQQRQVMDFLKENSPELYERLSNMRKSNEFRYERAVSRMWPRFQHLMQMPEKARQTHMLKSQLKIKIYKTAKRYNRATDEAQKNRLQQNLRELLQQKFDVEQQIHQHRLKQLEQHLAKLKEQLKQRTGQRDKIIQRRFDRLVHPIEDEYDFPEE